MATKKAKKRTTKAKKKSRAKSAAPRTKKKTARGVRKPAPKARPAKPAPTNTPRTLPDIEVEATGGKRFRLSSLTGTPVILYFYPKDDTPGCTQEGCDLRDRYADFRQRNVAIYGVSRDSVPSHDRFRAKYGFPFDLIADTDEKLCQAFGVMKEKNLYGKIHFGIERSTFVYDAQGKLAREYRGVKVPGHVADLLALVAKN